MHNNTLISLALVATLFIGCGSSGSSSNSSGTTITTNSSGTISVVQGMKKNIQLNIEKKDVTFQIVNKPNGISVELQRYGGILTYWAEGSVGEIHNITVQAVDTKGFKSKQLTLSFKTVSKDILPNREILSTGIDGDAGKARVFTKDEKGYVVDPFGNVWENELTGKALKSQLYIYAKNRCEILRLTNKDTNWRVPTADELLNLIDYSKVSGQSMLDDIFNRSNLTTWIDSGDDNSYMVVAESAGIINKVKFLDKFPVRCINAPKKSNEHIISTETGLNGNTYDFSTGLKWSPMTKDSYRKIIDDVNQSAEEYCKEYDNSSGWRLPNINEVRSIVDNDMIPISISKGNNVIFSSTPLNSKDADAKKAYYYLAIEKEKPIISVSPDTNISYPITCVKKIGN